MSALSAVYDILSADSNVTAKVSARLYFVEAAQASTFPAIVLHADSEDDGVHLGGSDQYPEFKFVVDCIGNNFGEAETLGDIVMAALRDYRGDIPGFSISYILHNDLDFFDRGESGQGWRRRLAFVMRYRALDA